MIEVKPWGNYEILYQGPGYQVKRVEVKAGLRLSLQKHSKRSEKWTIVGGTGLAVLGTESLPIEIGSSLRIPAGMLHRIHNTGNEPLVFIEVQFGKYLGEDDIVRVEDDFNRA